MSLGFRLFTLTTFAMLSACGPPNSAERSVTTNACEVEADCPAAKTCVMGSNICRALQPGECRRDDANRCACELDSHCPDGFSCGGSGLCEAQRGEEGEPPNEPEPEVPEEPVETGGCEFLSDCAISQFCHPTDRQCVELPNGSCRISEQCADGLCQIAEGREIGRCIADNSCNSDAQCGERQICAETSCVDVQCRLPEHCRPGQNCEGNICVTPAPEPEPEPEPGNNEADDHGNNAVSATLVADMSQTAGRIEVGADVDIFRFVATISADYEINTSSNMDTYCVLSDSAEAVMESDDDGGSGLNCSITSRLERGATYYILMRHFSMIGTGDYTLNLLRGLPDQGGLADQGDSVDSAAPVELPAQVAGEITAGDHDWFRFTPAANGNYRLETTSNIDTLCGLLDDRGGELMADDDGGAGLNCRIETELIAGTTYIFAVRGFFAFTSGAYTVGIALAP
jgi:hypothetical protein